MAPLQRSPPHTSLTRCIPAIASLAASRTRYKQSTTPCSHHALAHANRRGLTATRRVPLRLRL